MAVVHGGGGGGGGVPSQDARMMEELAAQFAAAKLKYEGKQALTARVFVSPPTHTPHTRPLTPPHTHTQRSCTHCARGWRRSASGAARQTRW